MTAPSDTVTRFSVFRFTGFTAAYGEWTLGQINEIIKAGKPRSLIDLTPYQVIPVADENYKLAPLQWTTRLARLGGVVPMSIDPHLTHASVGNIEFSRAVVCQLKIGAIAIFKNWENCVWTNMRTAYVAKIIGLAIVCDENSCETTQTVVAAADVVPSTNSSEPWDGHLVGVEILLKFLTAATTAS